MRNNNWKVNIINWKVLLLVVKYKVKVNKIKIIKKIMLSKRVNKIKINKVKISKMKIKNKIFINSYYRWTIQQKKVVNYNHNNYNWLI